MDSVAAIVVGGLLTLVNALFVLVLNQIWREIRALRDWKHTTNNTLATVCVALRISANSPDNALTDIDDRLEHIERALGLPPYGRRGPHA